MFAFSLPGGIEWLIILIIALLIFGPRLPSVMRSLGKSMSEFKKGMRDTEDEIKKTTADEPDKEIKE